MSHATADRSSVETLAQCTLEPLLGGISVHDLGWLHRNRDSEAMQQVEFECSQGCGTKLTGFRFFAPLTCCDTCKAKAEQEANLERAKTYWEAICPKAYRETDKTHAGFPKGQYSALSDWTGAESLFFYGPSGKGKSRLAMLLLKRCLVRFNLHIGILWPYDLKSVKNERDVKSWVQRWGRYDLLLMDDPLQGAADGRVTDALKDLLAYRMDWKRQNIVTSQIGGDDYEEQAAKFGKETKADKEVIAALLRRLRESCRVVSFGDTQPSTGQVDF